MADEDADNEAEPPRRDAASETKRAELRATGAIDIMVDAEQIEPRSIWLTHRFRGVRWTLAGRQLIRSNRACAWYPAGSALTLTSG